MLFLRTPRYHFNDYNHPHVHDYVPGKTGNLTNDQ